MAQNKGAIVHQKRKRPPSGHFLFLSSYSLIRSFINSLFLHALIFLHGLRGDCGRGLCAVSRLRIGRSRADRAPCLTTRHAHSQADHRYQYK